MDNHDPDPYAVWSALGSLGTPFNSARAAKFDELFLTGMIQHHKGALKMVADLREAGGGKEPNIGGFLNDVDNDQRAEIVRMYGLLGRPVEWK